MIHLKSLITTVLHRVIVGPEKVRCPEPGHSIHSAVQSHTVTPVPVTPSSVELVYEAESTEVRQSL